MPLTMDQSYALHRYMDDQDSSSKDKNRAKNVSWQRKATSLGLTFRPVSEITLSKHSHFLLTSRRLHVGALDVLAVKISVPSSVVQSSLIMGGCTLRRIRRLVPSASSRRKYAVGIGMHQVYTFFFTSTSCETLKPATEQDAPSSVVNVLRPGDPERRQAGSSSDSDCYGI